MAFDSRLRHSWTRLRGSPQDQAELGADLPVTVTPARSASTAASGHLLAHHSGEVDLSAFDGQPALARPRQREQIVRHLGELSGPPLRALQQISQLPVPAQPRHGAARP